LRRVRYDRISMHGGCPPRERARASVLDIGFYE
jgi:hypothetical protein